MANPFLVIPTGVESEHFLAATFDPPLATTFQVAFTAFKFHVVYKATLSQGLPFVIVPFKKIIII